MLSTIHIRITRKTQTTSAENARGSKLSTRHKNEIRPPSTALRPICKRDPERGRRRAATYFGDPTRRRTRAFHRNRSIWVGRGKFRNERKSTVVSTLTRDSFHLCKKRKLVGGTGIHFVIREGSFRRFS